MIEKICGMNTLIEGCGEPILFLHGYLSSKESFINQINFLKNKYTCIAPDLIGFGNQKMPYPFSLVDYSNGVNELIERLNLYNVNVIAHSFGARIVFKSLPKNEKIAKVVLTGPAGMKPKFSLKKWLKKTKYKIIKNFLPPEKLLRFGSADYKMLDSTMKRSFNLIISECFDKKLKTISNETLIIEGQNDKETPLYMAKRICRGLKNSSLVVLPNAGHFAFVDKKNEFNVLVKEFLAK